MTARFDALVTPNKDADWRAETGHRRVGFILAVVGLVLAAVTLVANLVAAADVGSSLATLRWSFGFTTLAFGTVKVSIAIILAGILIRLWHRVDAVTDSLGQLARPAEPSIVSGKVKTPYGSGQVTQVIPEPLPIHKMARTMWFPMLVMGAMAVVAGTVVSVAWANSPTDVAIGAWTQGLQFLGEAMVLSGISFLLGAILAALREGGGRVQESLGLPVTTLDMPVKAKIFVGLMMLGLMIGVLQFVLYLVVAGGVANVAAWFAWLGPLREVSLGLILAAIVMALAAIGDVLGFQFSRIRQILAVGT